MESSRTGCVGSGSGSLAALSIIRLPTLQHCDQDGRKAVSNSAERPSVFVSKLAKASIVKLAERIVLNATARPMIHCISKPLAAAAPHDDLPALAALLGHRRDPAMRSESIVIPLGERI